MKPKLIRRVEKLETKDDALSLVPVRLFKFAMEIRRMPPEKRNIRPDCNLREPDLKTCRKFGQWNIAAIKAVRNEKQKGRSVFKIIRSIH